MPYINYHYTHDIFFSYAHGRADRQGTKRLKFWSERLREELIGEIVDLLPEFTDLDIFIDDQLDPTEPLTDSIQTEIKGSGLLLIVMSEHYLRSSWCNDELEWFEAEVKRRGHEGGLVLVVRAHPTSHESWPDCLKDERGHVVLGFKFHSNSRRLGELVQPYGWPKPLPEDRPYYEELGKLASIVTQRLRKIKTNEVLKIKALAPRVEIRIHGEPNVYLHAPHNIREEWNAAREKLIAAGFRVLPEALPDIGSDFTKIKAYRKDRLKKLQEEAHVLCLLSPPTAGAFEREIESMVSDRIALQVFDKDIPCAILNLGEGDPPLAADYGIELIDAREDNWLTDFLAWVKRALDRGPS